MTLVSKTLPTLINGVSQQPPILRLASQGEAQVNGYSHPVDGLTKRPPTENVAEIPFTCQDGDFFHTINRASTERYFVGIKNGDMEMFTFDGSSVTLSFPDGKGYLNSSNPDEDFVAVTLADSTFILNKTKVIAKLTGNSTGTLKGTKQLFSDLPTTGLTNGDVWMIQGNADDKFAAYYVKWDSTAAVWKETTLPGIQYRLDGATMPWELVKTGTNAFTFRKITWIDRVAGDDDTNPFPSFLGRTLSDLFFIDNRLALVCDDFKAFSEVGEPYNYFRTTVTALLDSDPCEGEATTNKVSLLKFAVPHNGSIVSFSETTQFLLPKDVSIKPPGVPVKSTTEYESTLLARPVGIGQEVFFTIPKGSYSGLRSYFVVSDTDSSDADEITAHVPHFLPGNIFKMAASTNENIMLALTMDVRNRIYLYQFYNQRSDTSIVRIQSAFHYWEFAEDDVILTVETIGSTAHLLIERADGIYHETVPLNSGQVEPEFTSLAKPFLALLDRKVRLTGSYNSGTNTTTWTLPYADEGDFMVVKGSGWSPGLGANVEVAHPTSTTLTATGDYSAHQCIIGRKYTFSYTFSEFVMTKTVGSSQVAVTTGMLTMVRLLISFFNTGYFKVTVTTRGTESFEEIFSRTIGAPGNLIGEVALESGIKDVRLVGEPKDLLVTVTSDSYLPVRLLSATWEGEYDTQSQGT